jgi:hypothetical protein
MALKELGNEHFKGGKYKEAEQAYSEAYVPSTLDFGAR